MPIKPLYRLMFAQGGMCFFCNKPLPQSEASVEHLVPSSRDGSNSDDNCVACCKSINRLLGSMALKEKLRVVLNQQGKFICPKHRDSIHAVAPAAPNPAVAPKPAAAPKPAVAPPPAAAPKPTAAQQTAKVDNYTLVLNHLEKSIKTRPKTITTLRNWISSRCNGATGSLTETQLEKLIEQLKANGKLTVSESTVSYSL